MFQDAHEPAVNTEELESLFAAQQSNAASAAGPRDATKVKKEKLLSSKCEQDLSGFLKNAARSMNLGPADIVQALLACNIKVLQPDFLGSFLEKKLEAEIEKVESAVSGYGGSGLAGSGLASSKLAGPPKLTSLEQFVYDLRVISNLTERLERILFTVTFDEQFKVLQDKIQLVKRAFTSARQSSELPKLVALFLAIGNFVNGSHKDYKGAYGFQLSSGLKLFQDCKSGAPSKPSGAGSGAGSQETLLEYSFRYAIEKEKVNVENLLVQLKDATDMCKLEQDKVLCDFGKLKLDVQKVEKELAILCDKKEELDKRDGLMAHLEMFLSPAGSNPQQRMTELARDVEEAEEAFRSFAAFLVENKDTKWENLCKVVLMGGIVQPAQTVQKRLGQPKKK